MKILTYNVNGIRAAMQKGLVQWLADNDFDVVCLQELKADVSQIDLPAFENLGYRVYAHSALKKGYSGVALMSRIAPDHVETGCGNKAYDNEGRVLRADFGRQRIFSIYFPSGTTGEIRQNVKYAFLDFIYDYLHAFRSADSGMIVCGDYNIANKEIDIHDPKGNKNSSGFLPEERAWMDKFFASGFADAFRHLNKEPHQYTWWSFRANARKQNKGWRIDYISVTENLLPHIRHVEIMPDAMHSDHCPMLLDLAV